MRDVVADEKFSDSSKKRVAHVLIVASGVRTHLDIFLQLLHHLARKYPGTTVTVVSTKEQIARLESFRSGGDLALDLHLKDLFGNIKHQVKNSKFPPLLSGSVEENELDAEPLRKELVARKDAPGAPTCIISSKLHYWAEDWASELGIPWYPIHPNPCPALVFVETASFGETDWKALDTLSNGIPNVSSSPFLSVVQPGDVPAKYRETCARTGNKTKRATAIVINSCEGLHLQAGTVDGLRAVVQSSRVFTIGPILRYSRLGFGFSLTDSEDDASLDWLDSQRENSVLYIAFGTTIEMTSDKISHVATGIEASGVPFLWVLQSQSTLSELLAPGFVDRTKGRGRIETGFVPQPKILSHPSIGGFLCQCGWNSLMEATYAGVPVIAWPIGADQAINVRFMMDFSKAGYSISNFKAENKHTFEDIGSREIEKAVRHVMLENGTEDVKGNMRAMQKIMHTDMAEGGSSYQNLEAFLKEIANY